MKQTSSPSVVDAGRTEPGRVIEVLWGPPGQHRRTYVSAEEVERLRRALTVIDETRFSSDSADHAAVYDVAARALEGKD